MSNLFEYLPVWMRLRESAASLSRLDTTGHEAAAFSLQQK
jgi:hypothetical protein